MTASSRDRIWIDSHCHLEYEYEGKTTEDLVKEAGAEGVATLVTIGTEIPTFEKVQRISESFENVFHTIGVHPHEAKTMDDPHLDQIKELSKHEKCRAIGEIGLDFHYDHSPREVQIQRFKDQLDLALDVRLPVVIHARDAEKEMLPPLTEYAKKAKGSPGVIHCFTGTLPFGKACLDLGFYISFSGILTFKKAEDLRECANAFPLDQLLVETDSPYLAPIPYRGKPCEPKMVVQTGMKLAEIKNVPVEKVAQKTTENTTALFQL